MDATATLSRQTTLHDELSVKKPSAQTSITESSRPDAWEGPDPPPPSQHVQFLRWLKLYVKASFKPDRRPYNPHSGF
jgi:hypothetical protein